MSKHDWIVGSTIREGWCSCLPLSLDDGSDSIDSSLVSSTASGAEGAGGAATDPSRDPSVNALNLDP